MMRSRLAIVALVFCTTVHVKAFAQGATAANVHVSETAGIRRSGYPVNARVPLAKGALNDPAHTRLMLSDKEIAAQVSAESRWPDQSVQWLDVDFNATIGPLEQQTYRLEYGNEIKAAASARGLSVMETPESVQVGNVRFNKKGTPLIGSVHYRQEDVGNGDNGFAVTDTSGASHNLLASEGVKVEVVKPGPLLVVVRYSGKASIDGALLPFTISAEMPNSKTWVKYSVTVEDSAKRLRDVAFNTAISFGAFPWLWDFGTGSWSYGSFRNATDSVILTQTVKAGGSAAGSEWTIKTGPKGQETPYEVAAGNRSKIAEGWGHFQDAKEVIAFGFDRFGRQPGTYTVQFDGQGQASFRYAAAVPSTHHELTIYQHYVATPTPIGAITSPVSMLNGLTAVCDREQYSKAGLPVPK